MYVNLILSLVVGVVVSLKLSRQIHLTTQHFLQSEVEQGASSIQVTLLTVELPRTNRHKHEAQCFVAAADELIIDECYYLLSEPSLILFTGLQRAAVTEQCHIPAVNIHSAVVQHTVASKLTRYLYIYILPVHVSVSLSMMPECCIILHALSMFMQLCFEQTL